MSVCRLVVSLAGACLTVATAIAQTPTLSVKSYAAPSAQHIRTADLNKDGFSDLVLFGDNYLAPYGSQYPGTPLAIMLNDGNGGFKPATVIEESGYVTVATAVGDLNGDGLPDIAACESPIGLNNQNTLNIYLNQGKGNFTLAHSMNAPWGCSTIAIGPSSTGGYPDIALATEDSGAGNEYLNLVTTFFNDGTGNFPNSYNYQVYVDGNRTEDLCGIRDEAGADFNGDGILDLVVVVDCNYLNNASNIFLLVGQGGGIYGSTLVFESNHDFTANEPYVADVNGDGKPDVILVGQQQTYALQTLGDLQFLIDQGNNAFANVPVAYLQTASTTHPDHIYAGASGNFNGDAYPDAVIAYEKNGTPGLAVRYGTNKKGGFGNPVVLRPPGGTPVDLAAADYNQSGLDGFAVLESSSAKNWIVVYQKAK